MIRLSLIFTVLMCILGAALSISMGIDWLTIGYGLNPWIAFPAAAYCIACIPLAFYFWRRIERERLIRIGLWATGSQIPELPAKLRKL